MGEDGRCHHAQADAEKAAVGRVELALELAPDSLELAGHAAAAQLGGPADPAEAGVVLGGSPLLRRLQLGTLAFAVDLLEERRVVGTLAPDELAPLGFALGVGLQEFQCLSSKLLLGDLSGVGSGHVGLLFRARKAEYPECEQPQASDICRYAHRPWVSPFE